MRRIIINWGLSLFILMLATAAQADINNGLAGHWAFDENSGTGGNVGTGAKEFDGVDDFLDTPSQSVPSSNEFSFSWWMKSSSASGNVFCWTNYRCASFSGGKLIFYVDGGSSSSAKINTPVTDGRWHHIVFVNVGNAQSIYLNGKLAGTAAETLDTRAGGIRIGNRVGSTSFYKGLLDDVRFYNRALPMADIGALFDLGTEKNDEPLPPTDDDTGTDTGTDTDTGTGACANAAPTQWYVEKGSSGNGISWGSAWGEINQINWACIKPGDTIYIGGGANGLVYTTGLTIQKSGTATNPITITTGIRSPNPQGHEGRVILKNGGISFGNSSWVVLEGRKDPNIQFIKASDLADVNVTRPGLYIPGEVYLADNINMEVLMPDYFQGCVYFNGLNGNEGAKLFGVEIHHCGEPMDREVELAEVRAIKPYPDAVEVKRPRTGLEIAYNYIHHTRGDAINSPTPTDETHRYGIWGVHHNVIEKTRDDGVQVGPGADVYSNIIRTWWYPNNTGHPDGIQIAGNYVRIFNNIMYDLKNSYIRMESWTEQAGHWQIYNNVFFVKDQLIKNSGQKLNEGPLVAVAYSFASPITKTFINNDGKSKDSTWYGLVTWDDLLIANNSFVNFEDGGALYIGYRGFNPEDGDLTNGYVGDLVGTNIRVVNNVFHNVANEGGGVLSFQVRPLHSGDVVFENNSISGPNLTTYIEKDIVQRNIFHETPLFINLDSNDVHVLSQDTALINQGVNLSSYFTTDSDGVSKGPDTIWDIGPYENVECASSNPVAYFETLTTSGYVPLKLDVDATRSRSCDGTDLTYSWDFGDGSLTQGATGLHTFTQAGNYAVTVTAKSGSNHTGTYQKTIRVFPAAEPGLVLYLDFNDNILDQSGRVNLLGQPQHVMSWGGNAQYDSGKSGRAAVIGSSVISTPHVSDLVGMTSFSYAVWVKKSTPTSSGAPIAKVGAYFLKILSSGFSVNLPGLAKTVSAANVDTNWHHYAVTYNGSVARWFFDGKKLGEAFIGGAIAPANTRALVFGAYLADPTFNGLLDELKIYERALSDAEVRDMHDNPPPAPPTYQLSVNVVGSGTITSANSGIDCGNDCSETLSLGSSVTLIAQRKSGYIFNGWSGACSGSDSCLVSMGSNKQVTATFVPTVDPDAQTLLLHLNLDDDFSDNVFTDSSSYSTHGVAIGPNNAPFKIAGPVGTGAGEFRPYADLSIPETGALGSCIAVPNASRFQNLKEATISVWAHYYTAPNGDWTANNSAALLSAGYAKAGSWELARNGSSATLFFMYATNGVSNKVYLRFPDESAPANGDSGGFNHYVVTFNKGTAEIYYNGKFIQSAFWPIDHLAVSGLAPWIGIGCKTHATTPGTYQLDYGKPGGDMYPNHGWMNGAMDDVRIYDHALTASEIASIYDKGESKDDSDDDPQGIKGDVSGDGKVTMYDAALVLRFTLGSNLTDAQKTAADINTDGKVDGADVVAIARKALGL